MRGAIPLFFFFKPKNKTEMKQYRDAALAKPPKEKKSFELEAALEQGASIITEGKNYVTVRYPKKFNWVVFLLLLILGAIPGVFYLIYYAGTSPKEQTFKK